ncbi:hypothetical protein [Candidatus Accumulibacter sp. ACC012]|uniref:hypothetical protein n=1 Tax=Candidatus Accumulibacter sp. ACC012 TaxID=2823332 RepID=UPI0025BAC386|nr:hypothetical protein [Candidatus Accumulibacter sp. ACC012]
MRIVVTGSTAIENLVEHQQVWLLRQGLAIVSRCCWPPEKQAAKRTQTILDFVP